VSRDLAFLVRLGLVPLGLVLLGGCAAQAGHDVAAGTRPNILVILADDLGREAVGFTGGAIATPHLDALAASGMSFTSAFSQPLCTPSRVKMLTGRSNARNYIGFSFLDPRERTFVSLLRDAGYETAAAGKWQLYGAEHYKEDAGRGTLPAAAGFETWRLWQVKQLGSRYHDPLIEENGELLTDTSGAYGPDLFVDFLLDFIRTPREVPFLAVYPMALPHGPFVPTPASEDAASGRKNKQRNFVDMVEYTDELVGRLVAGLEAEGLRGDTLILFTCDNGTDRGIRTVVGDREIVGGKRSPTDAGTRVPFAVSWPGVVRAGSRCDDLIDFSDVLPTLVAVSGSALPTDRVIDGRSFLPQLTGELGVPRDHVFIDHDPRPGNPAFPPERFVRGRRYKLYDDGRFFDVVADPDELVPLDLDELGSPEQSAAHARLTAALDAAPPRSAR